MSNLHDSISRINVKNVLPPNDNSRNSYFSPSTSSIYNNSSTSVITSQPSSTNFGLEVDISSPNSNPPIDIHSQNSSTQSSPPVAIIPSTDLTNQFSMITMAKAGIYKPKILLTEFLNSEPPSVKLALKCSHWVQAI